MDSPTYEQVCTGETGHAEAVKVVFDSSKVTFATLCKFFLHLIDPTTVNYQDGDVGTQYRSGIYTVKDDQLKIATDVIATTQSEPKFIDRKIVVEVEPAQTFWPAEDYHQNYFAQNGGECHITLKAAMATLN